MGLAVSAAGNVLYAVNSDFDLQYTGGTVQSYDLTAVRNDTVALLLGIYRGAAPFDAGALDAGIPAQLEPLPFAPNRPTGAGCPNTCAPPMNSGTYWRDAVTIGALATDIQLSKNGGRLFVPVVGDTTLTWMDVQNDGDPRYVSGASPNATAATYAPFFLSCNRDSADECDSVHHAGRVTDPGNTRQLGMPADPFAMAFSDDGTAIAVTHENQTESSLFLSGFVPANPSSSVATAATLADGGSDAGLDANAEGGVAEGGVLEDAGFVGFVAEAGSSESLGQNAFEPSIQFILTNMPQGGDGIVSVPHDLAAIPNPDASNPLRPAFLQTNNSTSEIDLLRYYTDQGPAPAGPDASSGGQVASSNDRPFLLKERGYSVSSNSTASTARGIAIDPTPRMACEWNATHSLGLPTTSPEYIACAQTPARVFIASESPPSLVLGQIGGVGGDGATYDPDQLTISGQVALADGPSKVYVAPIVDTNGLYAVRVFVVCFDSQTITVYDPETQQIENVVATGPGPFAMAFDPFDLEAVAAHAAVPYDPRSKYGAIAGGKVTGPALRAYRFAYIASFAESFVQVMDLDESFKDDRLGSSTTFENIVYTLGVPTESAGPN